MNTATTHLADSQHPWIGLASFTEGDREFFAGRGEEIDELFRLVRREVLTLLYGVSGLGKTSLLQAGLFPALPIGGGDETLGGGVILLDRIHQIAARLADLLRLLIHLPIEIFKLTLDHLGLVPLHQIGRRRCGDASVGQFSDKPWWFLLDNRRHAG